MILGISQVVKKVYEFKGFVKTCILRYYIDEKGWNGLTFQGYDFYPWLKSGVNEP